LSAVHLRLRLATLRRPDSLAVVKDAGVEVEDAAGPRVRD
jgi:hypothetical protein